MKKTAAVVGSVIAGLAGLYLLVVQPSVGMTNRLELLQQEEYAHGCKEAADGDVSSAAPHPTVTQTDESRRHAVAEDDAEEQRAEIEIDCPDTASRSNLIAIDSLRMARFAALVAYILAFVSLLSVFIAVRQGTRGDGAGVLADHALMGLRVATTDLEHATLVIMNVGASPLWLRSVHVNDDPAALDGTTGGIVCLPAGGSHFVDVRLRTAFGPDLAFVQVRYDRVDGVGLLMFASLTRSIGEWFIRDVGYHD